VRIRRLTNHAPADASLLDPPWQCGENPFFNILLVARTEPVHRILGISASSASSDGCREEFIAAWPHRDDSRNERGGGGAPGNRNSILPRRFGSRISDLGSMSIRDSSARDRCGNPVHIECDCRLRNENLRAYPFRYK